MEKSGGKWCDIFSPLEDGLSAMDGARIMRAGLPKATLPELLKIVHDGLEQDELSPGLARLLGRALIHVFSPHDGEECH